MWRLRNVPVPEAYLIGLAIAVVLHRARPVHTSVGRRAGRRLGWPLILGGAGLVAASVRAAGIVDIEHASQLITTGPYARGRNPMYTGWAMASLGAGLAADSGWIVAAVPLAAWRIHREILREEADLTAAFGDEFTAYRARVPRYGLTINP